MRKLAIAVLLVATAALLVLPVAGDAGRKPTPRSFVAKLSGRAEVPPNDSAATGRVTVKVSRAKRSLRVRGRITGLSGLPSAAHIHLGRPGVDGPPILTIVGANVDDIFGEYSLLDRITRSDFTQAGNVQTFGQAVRAIRRGRTYVNVHTAKFPGGEVRGQVILP